MFLIIILLLVSFLTLYASIPKEKAAYNKRKIFSSEENYYSLTNLSNKSIT